MPTQYDISPNELNDKLAARLKGEEAITPPEWAPFVKTGHFKARPPVKEDWWYSRAAAVFRKVSMRGPIGVAKLRVLYGGKKNRGYKPEKFGKASGNIIRKILQQLEKAELIKQDQKGVHKGRVLTPKGQSLLDKTAASK